MCELFPNSSEQEESASETAFQTRGKVHKFHFQTGTCCWREYLSWNCQELPSWILFDKKQKQKQNFVSIPKKVTLHF